MLAGAFASTKGADEEGATARIMSTGLKVTSLGENVVRIKARPDRIAAETVAIWMHMPADRKNRMSPDFTRTGIGIARHSDGDYYITQDFAN